MRRLCTILALGALLAGCSADFYERQADRDVAALVNDRERKTLGYKPQVETPVDHKDVLPTTRAYAKIPQTPIPPPSPTQVEPLRVELQYGPFGPKRFDWPHVEGGDEQMQQSSMGFESLEARIRNRLTFGPPSLADRPLKLDFFGSLKYGVEHGRSYQNQMEDLYLAALNVTLQRHLFEPRPFAGASLQYAGGQKDAAYNSALTTVLRAGVRQKLPYGGEVVAQGLVNFVDALDSNVVGGETASVALSGTIPLLRGAGMVNLEPLINGERELVYQVRTFENFRRDFVISIASQYFRLLNLQQAVLNRKLNYASFITLTERSRALYSVGRVGYIELQRALQEQLSAEDDLISSQESYLSALDDYKILLGMPTDQNVEIVPVELNVSLPKVTEAEAVALALKYRLDLQTSRDEVDDARRHVSNAR
ncbi:MAG TPA: TolC family protein, partial [Tepidisphaeraceae bacterium]